MPLHRISLAQTTAIGVSIAVHAAVAWGVVAHQPFTAFAPQPETAWTVELVDAADLLPAAAAPNPPPVEESRPPEPTPSATKAAVPARAQAPSPAPVAPPLSAPVQVAAASPAPPVMVAKPVAAAAPAPAEDPLVDYRRRVWAHLARQAPAAPPGAGVTVAVFGLDESGSVLFVRLGRSSGNPGFDRACLKAIRAASPLPKPPAGVGRAALVFELPVKARSL